MPIEIVSSIERGVLAPRRSREVLSEERLDRALHQSSSKLEPDPDTGKLVRTPLDSFTGYFLDDLNFDSTDEETQERLEGLDVGLHQMLDIEGQNLDGTFISAQVGKLGGDDKNKTTTVFISMGPTPTGDRLVYEMSFKKARRLGLEKRENPFGISLLSGKKQVQTMIFGFDTPLNFGQRLQLFVHIKEAAVSKVEAIVAWGANSTGGGDVTGSSGGGEEEFP